MSFLSQSTFRDSNLVLSLGIYHRRSYFTDAYISECANSLATTLAQWLWLLQVAMSASLLSQTKLLPESLSPSISSRNTLILQLFLFLSGPSGMLKNNVCVCACVRVCVCAQFLSMLLLSHLLMNKKWSADHRRGEIPLAGLLHTHTHTLTQAWTQPQSPHRH